MDIEELKGLRSSLKANISNSASRLQGSIARKLSASVINGFYTELETYNLDFYRVNSEYKSKIESDVGLGEHYSVVDNLNLSQYSESVDSIYTDVRAKYDEFLECLQSEKNSSILSAISENINVLRARINVVILRLSSQMNVEVPDVTELLVGKEELEVLSAQLLASLHKLVEYPSIDCSNVRKDIHDILKLCDENKHKVSVALKKIFTKASTEVKITTSEQSFVVPVTGDQSQQSIRLKIVPEIGNSVSVAHDLNSSTPLTSHLSSGDHSHHTQGSKVTSQYPTNTSSRDIPTSQSLPTSLSHLDKPDYNMSPVVKIKRAELPTFSGLREDWPEFKTLWPRLAIPAFSCKELLALELRRCLVGQVAKDQVKNIPITGPESFSVMWDKLNLYYEDPAASVKAAMRKLEGLTSLAENDYKGLSDFVDVVEGCYSKLTTIEQKQCLTLRDVDMLSGLLPSWLKRLWCRKYHMLETPKQVRPFGSFMDFLTEERNVVARLVDQDIEKKTDLSARTESYLAEDSDGISKYRKCAVHKDDARHSTVECREFQNLSRPDKLEALRSIGACFRCFGPHLRSQCKVRNPCSTCNGTGHHVLLCRDRYNSDGTDSEG